jgi:diguanylate cyclase (GGDEF)-like protein
MRDLERKGQTESLEGYGVIVFDINNLKTTNDTKGHEAGDTLIKNACSLICTQFKHSPVFRIGGDEFVAILHGSDYDNRETLAKEFDSIIDENNLNDGVVVASGMAVFDPSIDTSYTHVFMRADKLMYDRKKALKHII